MNIQGEQENSHPPPIWSKKPQTSLNTLIFIVFLCGSIKSRKALANMRNITRENLKWRKLQVGPRLCPGSWWVLTLGLTHVLVWSKLGSQGDQDPSIHKAQHLQRVLWDLGWAQCLALYKENYIVCALNFKWVHLMLTASDPPSHVCETFFRCCLCP